MFLEYRIYLAIAVSSLKTYSSEPFLTAFDYMVQKLIPYITALNYSFTNFVSREVTRRYIVLSDSEYFLYIIYISKVYGF